MSQLIFQPSWEFERRYRWYSAFATGFVGSVMFFFTLWWNAFPLGIHPSKQEEFITWGRIDFGFDDLGSADINTFERPSPTPSPEPYRENKAPATSPEPSPKGGSQETVLTGTQPSDIKSPPSDEGSKTGSGQGPRSEIADDPMFGGSNHGNTSQLGNRGNPNSTVLDPDGGFAWGDGDMGLKGRRYISLKKPDYKVQDDARLTFEFLIAPDGHVKYVKPPVTNHLELKKAGMDAIYTWKFDPIDGETDQRVKVTINFRLQ